MNLSSTLSTARLSAEALLGRSEALFNTPATVYDAVLEIGSDVRVPNSTELLRRGRSRAAKVRVGSADLETEAIRALSIKFPDAYGAGRDQDFLLASSADGVPAHHLALPTSIDDSTLYSSLWLYLAGLTPILFGVQTRGGRLDTGAVADFCVSPPVGRFRPIGTLTLGKPDGSGEVTFAARNSGGKIRPLPPVSFY